MYLNKWITTSVHTRLDRARSKTLSRVSWVKKRDTQTIDMQDVGVGSVILLHVKGNRIGASTLYTAFQSALHLYDR